jgi:hypothetical protein
MEQLFEEEDKKEVEEEEEDEENPTKEEEQVQKVSPKTPRKRVQKNNPSDQIIGNKDAGVETSVSAQNVLVNFSAFIQFRLDFPFLTSVTISNCFQTFLRSSH